MAVSAESEAFALALIGPECDNCKHSFEDEKLMLLRCGRSPRQDLHKFLCIVERHHDGKSSCGRDGKFFEEKS